MKEEQRSDRVIVGAYVEPSLKRALEKAALKSDRSVSAEIRIALRAHLGLAATDDDQ